VYLLVLLIAVVIYLALLGLLWLHQERIVFQPPPSFAAFPVRSGSSDRVRQVSYRAEDDTRLFGFLVGDADRADQLLIAFHGNADLARLLVPWAQTAARVGNVAVLLPELRGYDGLPGKPTYVGAARDARAARRFIADVLNVPHNRVAYFGHSLGSAIAAELASESAPSALLLQSPFSSARAMARRMALPGLSLFWPIVSRVHYDTEERVRSVATRVSVAHGLRDLIVPVRMGRSVYEAASVKGELLLVPNAGHNDIAERAPADYWNWIRVALSR
jgi:fermentation-respiration switch protein FrsA (DUF1100 family)